jgi:hypothetical protein
MSLDLRVDEFASVRLLPGDDAALVGFHQTAITGHIGS